MNHPHRAGFSMLGVLITMVCIIVLFTIGMNAMNKAITGAGSALPGTVRSTQDMMSLNALYQAMIVGGQMMPDSRLPVPNLYAKSNDQSLNTTANFYSSMIAQQLVNPSGLISGNEYSPRVEAMRDYNYNSYQPSRGTYWDTRFLADLDDLSHTSFAHMPLYGERYRRGWQSNFDSRLILIGNRGPKDGIDDPGSYSYGRSGVWGGHFVYGDGRVAFSSVFVPEGLTYERNNQSYPDNIFFMETGAGGMDAIIAFTKRMTSQGPELQYD
ncbi:MAG TPA: hypothetical protein PK400_12285 [Phycisphaerales bacterium]|nr:hypothetical protein [Phycisphaerales bacterium]HRQ75405.1 hypothetical protein [Phycisphaerales bacterium]